VEGGRTADACVTSPSVPCRPASFLTLRPWLSCLRSRRAADAAGEAAEEAGALVEALVEHNGPELLVQRLTGFK
jgi:hypothetical protein